MPGIWRAKTVQPERGDYYLTPGGEPAQAPGRWLASPDTLAQLGIDGRAVDGRGLHRPDGGQAPERSEAGCARPARTAAGAAGST